MGSGIPVLMYHWVDDDLGDRLRLYGVTPRAFASHVARIRRRGGTTASLPALARHLDGSAPLPRGAIVCTFDDGYRDNVENAGPVLEAAGFSATIFVVTDAAGGVNSWDLRHGDPPRGILDWEAMRRLDGGTFRFEPHSRSHRPLPSLSDAEAREEISGSKKRLEDELGREASCFSYPHGEFSARVERLVVEAGFRMAVTDLQGRNRPGDDPLRVRRTMITSRDVAATWAFKAATGWGALGLWDEIKRRILRRPSRWETAP